MTSYSIFLLYFTDYFFDMVNKRHYGKDIYFKDQVQIPSHNPFIVVKNAP
jgi:hypothetical protein